ncbi:hypothetical protein BDV39DRAFT_197715 [Aspergillus sergii]|uniref:Uncharacterized protein n=1 Tax=Aspergillus sergii TaxID=1034303 RepID=A0A5N6WKR4_9EURO|nr:hypothetical protein BDV39DRAFT_197715 [Aspergillus sergii]
MFHITNFIQSFGACLPISATKPPTAIEAINEILAKQNALPSPRSRLSTSYRDTNEVVFQKYMTREELGVLDLIEAEVTWGTSILSFSGYEYKDEGRLGNHLSDARVASSKRRGQSFGGQPLKKQKSSNLLQSPTDDHPTERLFDLTKSPTDGTPGDEDITVPDPEETEGQTLSLKEAIVLARNAVDKMKQS